MDIEQAQSRMDTLRRNRVLPDNANAIGASMPAILAKHDCSEAQERRRQSDRIQQEAFRKAEAEADAQRRIKALESSGVYKRHMGADNLRRDSGWGKRLESLKATIGDGTILALIGDRGAGKTQLAVELLRHFVLSGRGLTVTYTSATDMFLAVREAFSNKHGMSERERVHFYAQRQYLVIDDLHDRAETEWEQRVFNFIIDYRYGNLLDTVLISNHSGAAFKAAVGVSVYSRLVEAGGIVVCDWPSFRAAKGVAQ